MTVFYTGNTGRSTGAHLDFRVYNPASGGYEDPSAYTQYLTVGDQGSPFDFAVTSGFQPGGRRHPVTGEMKPHWGIDYATPEGTAINVDGKLLSTWEDTGGGVMSQYLVGEGDKQRELLLLHGSKQNPITGQGAATDYSSVAAPSSAPADRAGAKAKAQDYASMSKAQLDSAYDALRSDPAKAKSEGMAMHKAFFNKP